MKVKNHQIAFISLIAVITGVIFEQAIINFFSRYILILNNPVLQNVILEIVIVSIPCLVVKIFSCEKFSLKLVGITFHGQVKNMFLGIAIGFTDIIIMYLIFVGMKFISFKGLGFEFYAGSEVIKNAANVFVIATFAGICEEIFFRGVLLNYLCKFKGSLFALIVSAVIFTIFHTSRYHSFMILTGVFIMAIVLGYCFISTKSLCLGIGVHFAIDFFTNLVSLNDPNLFIISLSSKVSSNNFQQIFICAQAIVIILIFMMIFVLKKMTRRNIKLHDNTY